MRTLRRLSLIALAAALLPACADEFQPRSVLADLRVLAIEASPVEVAAGQEVTLRPSLFVPDGQAVASLTWKFCPFSLGSQGGFQCLSPKCEFPLEPDASGTVVANPTLLAVQCALAVQGEGGADQPTGAPDQLPETFETLFTLSVATDAGESRQAVQRVKVWTQGAPPEPNRPPRLLRIELDGVEVPAGSPPVASVQAGGAAHVRVLVDPSSLDPYTDGNGLTRTEEPVVSAYTTAGRFDGDRTSGLDDSLTWTAEEIPAGVTEAQMFFVVRDLRGGESVSGPYLVTIAP